MRYLGNKTKLLPFILRAVETLEVEPGVACDPFAGTASVATALKRAGWRVHAGDLLAASYALQVARLELDRTPRFPASLLEGRANGGTISYRKVLASLEEQEVRGFVSEHYTLAGRAGREHGRMYFSPENGRRIDGIRGRIAAWREAGLIDRRRAQLLIATLIEAADRVANTTGVYASFVKSLQPNALRALELRPIVPTPGNGVNGGCSAFRGPARELLRAAGPVDLVYLDPPYNGRQYPGYYHIPELLALGWTPPPRIRGKTGLIPDDDLRSEWCRKGRVADALRDTLAAADGRHILLSYNDEGLLSAEEIETALRERGDPDSYRLHRRPYRRYRSDADGPDRSYARDRVKEHLHYVRCR
ncbi:MAG: DNA adenine methylase [Gemmatimonadota bacterium]|nr:DNA adenine methylase [Gemmatimonadota bacterium]